MEQFETSLDSDQKNTFMNTLHLKGIHEDSDKLINTSGTPQGFFRRSQLKYDLSFAIWNNPLNS